MKRVLITGVHGYIGCSLKAYLAQWPESYTVDMVSLRNDAWRALSFAEYDAVFHAAGIAHRKETVENAPEYVAVNCDLTVSVAEKAKADGVLQFIFLSSMSVYGMDTGVITPDTVPTPKSTYGRSKLEAETRLCDLETDSFHIAILRPPMVYGPGCKGNFQTFVRLVQRFPFFPRVCNRRSMIYIDNLSSFVKQIIDQEDSGLFFPQDRTYMRTSQMAMLIGEGLGKKLWLDPLTGLAVMAARPFWRTLRKAFGSLVYEGMENFEFRYCFVEQKDAVRRSVKEETQ